VPKDESDDDGFTARMTTGSNGVNLGGRGGSRRGGSDVIILPVQRAVNVVRACQNWVEGQPKASGDSDEEHSEDEEEGPSEDLESAMLAVFVGLAPILQNVIGKHWEFMWDVVETVLEVRSVNILS
jgi:stearoyl-CoA desaturase (delta-9 desaturase)